MFPLGSVLFPHMPLGLRVFEPRYVQLMADVLRSEEREFGVVLIERGWEVGGGDGRFMHGTVATLTELRELEGSEGAELGMLGVGARGGRRVAVREWLDDAPYPLADVEVLEPLPWDESLRPAFEHCEATVRRCLAIASEFSESTWAPDIELADDPAERCWQLAAIAPLGQLDQIGLLRSASLADLLSALTAQVDDAVELIRLQIDHSPEEGPTD